MELHAIKRHRCNKTKKQLIMDKLHLYQLLITKNEKYLKPKDKLKLYECEYWENLKALGMLEIAHCLARLEFDDEDSRKEMHETIITKQEVFDVDTEALEDPVTRIYCSIPTAYKSKVITKIVSDFCNHEFDENEDTSIDPLHALNKIVQQTIASMANPVVLPYPVMTKEHSDLDILKPAFCSNKSISDVVSIVDRPVSKRPTLPSDDGISAYIVIGEHDTKISREAWHKINWTLSAPAITRKILVEVFNRNTLATHSLSGKPSPAFIGLNKPVKNKLDQNKVQDIVKFMTKYFNMKPREVLFAITTKCADENKVLRKKPQKIFLNQLKESIKHTKHEIQILNDYQKFAQHSPQHFFEYVTSLNK